MSWVLLVLLVVVVGGVLIYGGLFRLR